MDFGAPDETWDNGGRPLPDGRAPRYRTWLLHWRDLLIAVRAIQVLVAARLPLAAGLLYLSHDTPSRPLRYVFYAMHRDIQGGLALHEAMANRPEFFPPFCTKLARAGEESGQLDAALDELQSGVSDAVSIRYVTFWHAWMLGGVLLFPILLAAVILVFVAPQLESILTHFGKPPGRLLYWGQFARESGLLAGLALFAVGVLPGWIAVEYSWLKGGPLSRIASAVFERLPLVGRHFRKRHLATAAAVAGHLLRAGAPLPLALREAGEAAGSRRCNTIFERLAAAVEGGDGIRDAVRRDHGNLPGSFRALVSLGEQGGGLPDAFQQIAALYRRQTDQSARLAIELGLPLLVCFNGLIVFWVYGAIFSTLNAITLLGI